MPSFTIVFLIIYAVVGFFHVLFRYVGLEYLKHFTKPLLLPFLIAALVFWQLGASANLVGILICCSLTCGWIGDIILMKHGTIRLIFGGIFFAAGHVFTISTAIYLITQLSVFYPIAFLYKLSFAAVIIIAAYYTLKDFDRSNPEILQKIGPYLIIYLVLLSLMLLLINTLEGQYQSPYLSIAALGSLCFYMSDWTLLRSEFKGATRAHSGTWMALYILGQAGISIGLYSFSIIPIAH